jgi:hypothetical protein
MVLLRPSHRKRRARRFARGYAGFTARASSRSAELRARTVARSGDLCQVNFFTQPEHAVYCGRSAGNWNCACGPAAENPMEFTSTDFCDLDAEARACQTIERCGFPL